MVHAKHRSGLQVDFIVLMRMEGKVSSEEVEDVEKKKPKASLSSNLIENEICGEGERERERYEREHITLTFLPIPTRINELMNKFLRRRYFCYGLKSLSMCGVKWWLVFFLLSFSFYYYFSRKLLFFSQFNFRIAVDWLLEATYKHIRLMHSTNFTFI